MAQVAAAKRKKKRLPSFAAENESELEEGDGNVTRCLVRLPFEVWKEKGKGQGEEEEESEEEGEEGEEEAAKGGGATAAS